MLLLALWALAPLGAAVDCHRVLGVERGADAAALKKAYRKRALETHPDRSSDPNADALFREVAECYEKLTNPNAPEDPSRRGGFSSSRAHRTFEDLFGDVSATWRPGMTVRGTIVSGGKRVHLVIYPDGSTEETTDDVRATQAHFTKMSATDEHGNTQMSINFSGGLGSYLAHVAEEQLVLVVPEGLRSL